MASFNLFLVLYSLINTAKWAEIRFSHGTDASFQKKLVLSDVQGNNKQQF